MYNALFSEGIFYFEVIMRIYCTKPMRGHSYEWVVSYYNELQDILEGQGWSVLNPMTGKSYLAKEREFKASGYQQPLSNDHAIVERDRWMTKQADVLLVNLLDVDEVSIGSMFEMAWGYDNGKHIVTLVQKESVHYHAFVLQTSHVIYDNLNDALDYLAKLIKNKI